MPPGDSTGTLTLTLFTLPGPSAIAADGKPVGVTIVAPGQRSLREFDATAGQRVSLQATGIALHSQTGTSEFGYLELYDPNGNMVTKAFWEVRATSALLTQVRLPDAGTYLVAVVPPGDSTGSLTLTLFTIQ